MNFLPIHIEYIQIILTTQSDFLSNLTMNNHLIPPLLLKDMLLDDEVIKVLKMLRYLLHHHLMLLLLQLLLLLPPQFILHSHYNQNKSSPEDLPVEAEVNRPEFHL